MEALSPTINLDKFFARYLCGGEALKSFRMVSRTQLALVKCEIGYFEPRAVNLAFQIDRFMNGVNLLLDKGIEKSSICRINSLLRNVELNDSYRDKDVWIGRTKKKAKHIPPSYKELDSLMSKWLVQANQENLSAKQIFGIYAQYLLIHPFPDGNGRTGRVIINNLLKRNKVSCLPPDLYRLSRAETNSFVEQIQSNQTKSQITTFIDGWFLWESSIRSQLDELTIKTIKLIESKLVMSRPNELQIKVISLLWDQPLISNAYVKKKLNTNDNDTNNALSFLIRVKILEEKKVKYNPNISIYQAPIILEFLHDLDDLIFLTKGNEHELQKN